MRRSTLTGAALAALAVLFVASWRGTAGADNTGGYVETDLVTNRANLKDVNGIVHPLNNPNAIVDANLVDAWDITEDITESATSRFWVSANGGTAQSYDVLSSNPLVAIKNSLSVSIPSPPGTVSSNGRPTGAVFNTTVSLPTSQQEFIISGFAQPDCSTNTAKATARLLVATDAGRSSVGPPPSIRRRLCAWPAGQARMASSPLTTPLPWAPATKDSPSPRTELARHSSMPPIFGPDRWKSTMALSTW